MSTILYGVFFFFFFRSLLSILIDRFSYAPCIECLSLRIYGNRTHEKGRNYVSHAMHASLALPSLSVVRRKIRISFFFLARKFTVASKKLKANPSWRRSKIEKKVLLKTFFVTICTCMCMRYNYRTFNLTLRI